MAKQQNKLFVVTGGLSGLGAATVERLHDEGGHVAIIDLTAPKAGTASDSSRIKFFQADVSNTSQVTAAVDGIKSWSEETGVPIQAIICCAGFLGSAKIISKNDNPIALERFTKVVDISLTGTIDVIRQLLPHVSAQPADEEGQRGVIVTVASAAAFDGQEGQVAYSAAKGALAALTLPLARDLSSRGIRAVCIAPGLFETGMSAGMPEKARQSLDKTMEYPTRPGRAEEFAGLVEHVIGNRMLNGTVIRLDGATRMPARL
ncbi:hypothetical protein ACHAQA_003778 [Verticillium albo-atrum]